MAELDSWRRMIALLVACAQTPSENVDTGPAPLFAIESPADGETVERCFTAVAASNGVSFVSPVDHPENVAGEGHWHVILDSRYFVCESASCDVRIEDIEAGPFTLVARLVQNDYTDWLDGSGDVVEDHVELSLADAGCDVDSG